MTSLYYEIYYMICYMTSPKSTFYYMTSTKKASSFDLLYDVTKESALYCMTTSPKRVLSTF